MPRHRAKISTPDLVELLLGELRRQDADPDHSFWVLDDTRPSHVEIDGYLDVAALAVLIQAHFEKKA